MVDTIRPRWPASDAMTDIEWTTGFTYVEKALAPIEVVLASCGLVLYSRIARRLRDQHSEVWRKLGSPTLFSTTAAGSGFTTILFLLQRGHRELGDPELQGMVRWWAAVYVLFLCGLVAFVYQVLRYGP